MKNLILLTLTLLLNASPIEPSLRPFRNAQNAKENVADSTAQPTAAYSNTDQALLCLSNRSELFNVTLINATAGNSSTHRCPHPVNSTGSIDEASPLTISNKLVIAAFLLILVIGTFGNAYVIYIFAFTFKKRTVTETMLIYLAFVDLFASLINPLLFIYWIITRFRRWDFGILGCKILPPVGPISTTASSAIIIIICIDRYRSIVTPFKSRFSQLQVHILCSLGILISVLFYSYYISALSLSHNGGCQVQQVNELSYSIPNVTVTLIWDVMYIIVFIPTNIRIFMHLRISRELQTDTSFSRIRKRGNRKVMRILLTVGVVFAVLVFPKDILHLAFTLSWIPPPGINRTPVLVTLNSWFKVLQVSNSCVNIFIYSKMHNRFRNEITNFLRRIFRRPAIQFDNESSEDKTKVSVDLGDGSNGGLLKLINDKIVRKLSPKTKRKVPPNENGELDSLTRSPRWRKVVENGVGDSPKKRKAVELHPIGKADSSNETKSIIGRHKMGDRRLLLHDEELRNGELNFDSDEEGFTKGGVYGNEPRPQREDMHQGLMRMEKYSQHRYQGHASNYAAPPKLYSSVHDNGLSADDGREVAKILECYKKSGIKSRETHC